MRARQVREAQGKVMRESAVQRRSGRQLTNAGGACAKDAGEAAERKGHMTKCSSEARVRKARRPAR